MASRPSKFRLLISDTKNSKEAVLLVESHAVLAVNVTLIGMACFDADWY